jgi:mono/diheme cytochrome c family protein
VRRRGEWRRARWHSGDAGAGAGRRAAAALLLVACAALGAARAGATDAGAATPGAADAASRVAAGQALFDVRCGICHAAGGTGAFMLGRRLGADRALLASRRDLPEALVVQVVRHGINGMPVFTRVDLTDAELALVVAYLTRAPAAGAAD